MSANTRAGAWGEILSSLEIVRPSKPRQAGITMVIDKSFGVESAREFAEVAGPYVDVFKMTSLTSFLYPGDMLRRKVALLRDAGIEVAPGGTFAEVMLWRGEFEAFLDRAKDIGFTGIEISDGTIQMDDEMRKRAIGRAAEKGFIVFSEVGRKEWSDQTDLESMVSDLKRDLAYGAAKVIVEAMEFGKSVGIVDEHGQVSEEGLWAMVEAAGDAGKIIWEAPLRQQQEFFIDKLGSNVNLGNIPPVEALVLEATRLGLTGIPFMSAYLKSRGIQ